MLLDISNLDPHGAGPERIPLDHEIDVPPFAWEGGDKVVLDPVRLVGTLRPTRRGIELAARYDTVAHLHCSRCLEAVDRELGAQFRLFVLPGPGAEGERGYEDIPEDDPDAVDLYPIEGEKLDLAAVLREQVDLALPLRALCREDCRGICSGCGAELNRESCRCERPGDERLGALADIKSILQQKRQGQDPSRGH